MSDTEEPRKKWIKERATYEDFSKLIANRLKVAVQANGIWCESGARAKDVPSLIKKLLKGKHTYETLPDKAGARCVVRYLCDLNSVVSLAQQLFDCSEPDDKLKERQDNQVGYISIHLEAKLKSDDELASKFPPHKYWAELQIRTMGQHLWAEMAHDTVYKNDELLSSIPAQIKRRVNLTAGLLEIADHEFDRLNKELALDPAVEIFKQLETYYYRLTSRRPDPELSLAVINMLMPLYGNNVKHIEERIATFFWNHHQELITVYEGTDDWKASALLYQPEALMLLERLEVDDLKLRRVWKEQFPEKELERFANAFGISFD
jgi:putative GTP pyrophosphokinase